MDHAYVQHALLTKRQEQELGKAIQRANQLCQRVHALVLEKRYSFGEDELARVATHDNTDEQRQQGTYVVLASEQRRIRIEQPQHRDILARRIQLLTEQDIRDGLGLDGGHVEVNNIVRRGALAREELILCNLRLVVSIAQLFAKRGGRNDYIDGWNRPSLEEAIQEGILGLTTAVERYEPLRNVSLQEETLGLTLILYHFFLITPVIFIAQILDICHLVDYGLCKKVFSIFNDGFYSAANQLSHCIK
jgi:DNA-directed RNA polymerase sigma subunit (sigma70/sigma32)